MFASPSAQLDTTELGLPIAHPALRRAIDITERMERNGNVTLQDCEDLNTALNPRGVGNGFALPDSKNLLVRYINKPFTPEIKHKVAQAIMAQFSAGIHDVTAGFVLELPDQEENEFKAAMANGQQSFAKAQNTSQQAAIADQEMDAVRLAAERGLKKFFMTTSMMDHLEAGLEKAAESLDVEIPQSTKLVEPEDDQTQEIQRLNDDGDFVEVGQDDESLHSGKDRPTTPAWKRAMMSGNASDISTDEEASSSRSSSRSRSTSSDPSSANSSSSVSGTQRNQRKSTE